MPGSAKSSSSTLWVIAAVQFLTPFMFSAIGVALPSIGKEFSAGAVQLGLVEMVYILAVALLLLPIGRYADIHGRKNIFLSGIVVITAATVSLALAPTIGLLIFFRFFQGIGAAMITSSSLAILSSSYPPEERGKALGVVVSCVYLGISAGPLLAGLMIDFLGWRWIFYCAVPVECIILLFALLRLKGEWAGARGEPFDWTGSLLYIIALFCIIVGVLQVQAFSGAWWLAGLGLIVMIIFLAFETSIEFPIFPLKKIIANKVFALSNIATWLNYAASFGITFFFSIYLQVIRGIPPKITGFILITQPLLMALCAPIAGRLADTYSPAPIATTGMALCTVAMACATFINSTSSILLIFAVLIIMGIGFGFFSTPNTTAIMASIDKQEYGMAASVIATMRTFGMLTAMTLITVLLSWFLGKQPIAPETGPVFLVAMRVAMTVFSLLGAIGIVCSISRTRKDEKPKPCKQDFA
ncbi:MAG: MFS transporter [Proteobacteria bacterium]|nr:MFS transporter [Pseudomonadota bacterium]